LIQAVVMEPLANQAETDDHLVSIYGRLIDERGTEPEDADLDLSKCPQGATYEIDKAGNFVVTGQAGTYELVGRAPAMVPTGARDLVLSEGETVRGVDLVFTRGVSLEGNVVSSDDENGLRPVGGAQVFLEGGGYLLYQWSDDDGRFNFEGLPPGVDFTVSTFDETWGSDEQHSISGTSRVRLFLQRNQHVTGVVLKADGSLAVGAAIIPIENETRAGRNQSDPFGEIPTGQVAIYGFSTCGPSWPACLGKTRTDDAGRFEIDLAKGVELRLAAVLGDEVVVAPPLSAGQTDVTLQLEHKRDLVVKVSDQSGQPVAGKAITVSSTKQGFDMVRVSATTNEEGQATLKLWPSVAVELSTEPDSTLEFPNGMASEVTVKEVKVRHGRRKP
jgi:hypothetical protein